MGKRAAMLGLVALALGCGGDSDVDTGREPASECECPLDLKIENLALCISPTTAFGPSHVYSSHWSSADSRPACEPWREIQPLPSMPWSGVKVSSQCAGTGQFCVTVWTGNAREPGLSDCRLARVCSAINYPGGGQVIDLASIPSWVSESSECSQRYERDGGYLELSVDSEQLGCDRVSGSTQLVPLCPLRCQSEPMGAGCEVCGNSPELSL